MYSLTIPRIAVPADGHRDPVRQLKTVRRPPIYPNGAQAISPAVPSPPFCCPHAVHRCPSVDSGLGAYVIDGRCVAIEAKVDRDIPINVNQGGRRTAVFSLKA